jgi:DNA-binding transcriptional regulator YhcF (GntR family)
VSQSDAAHMQADDQRAVDGVSEFIDAAGINPQSMLPAYVQLAVFLRGTIIVRQLPPGTPLPSEPELTQRYGVSRDTVRKSMALLRRMGIAATRRGVGHFVARTPEIQRVRVEPGSRVVVRSSLPSEQDNLLGLTVFVVSEPGKPPVSYDTTRTLLVFP